MTYKLNMQKFFISTLEDLEEVVTKLLKYAAGRKKMVFYGEIGAGKTTLIQVFCKRLKVQENATSPTFALINEYSYPGDNSMKEGLIYHIDLYRLKNIQEALNIGIEEYLYGDHHCLIEWPEIIESLLPEDTIRIKLEILSDSERKILFL